MSNEYRRIEVITGDVVRRRWTTEQKLRIIEESFEPGEPVSSAARLHGLRQICFTDGAGFSAKEGIGLRRDRNCLGRLLSIQCYPVLTGSFSCV
uniref:Transposase family protein n=1 Tax=Rhizobium rhizogenes TaxID=359 RepID=A0A7S5DQC4_RHIRH|nr:transposase family protein [Rhizobium rhizogenes]QCL09804.1 transposase family protein [Rhizobium rhizogenes]